MEDFYKNVKAALDFNSKYYLEIMKSNKQNENKYVIDR